MFTVIFVNSRTEQQRRNYQFLFQPFIDKGEMCFCPWFTEENSIETAAPDLYRILKDKKEWRAVILNMDSSYDYGKNDKLAQAFGSHEEADDTTLKAKENNPFDYSDIDSNTEPHESTVPLIRLTHMLAGYNYSRIKGFRAELEYYNDELEEIRSIPEDYFDSFHVIKSNKKQLTFYRSFDDERKNELLDKRFLYVECFDDETGKTYKISIDVLMNLFDFQFCEQHDQFRFLYVSNDEDGNVVHTEYLMKDRIFLEAMNDDEVNRLSQTQFKIIEYYLSFKSEGRFVYQPDGCDAENINQNNLFVDYVDHYVKRHKRISFNSPNKVYKLQTIKRKDEMSLLYIDETRNERRLDKNSTYIEYKNETERSWMRFSIADLENYLKLIANYDNASFYYVGQQISEAQYRDKLLDKHMLFVEFVNEDDEPGQRLSLTALDMFRMFLKHRNDLQFVYLPDPQKAFAMGMDQSNALGVTDAQLSDEVPFERVEKDHLFVQCIVEAADEEKSYSQTHQLSVSSILEIEDVINNKEELKAVFKTVLQDDEHLNCQKDLSNKYRFADNRPTEILLFATRHKAETDEKEALTNLWASYQKTDQTLFWERNNYPACCRFMYMDVMNSDNYRYEQDLLKFWVSVLLLSHNCIGATAVKAYNLYKIKLDINEDKLFAALNSQLNLLDSAYHELQFYLQSTEDYTFEPDDVIFHEESLAVRFTDTELYDAAREAKRDCLRSGDNNKQELADLRIEQAKTKALDTTRKQRVLDANVREIRRRSFEFVAQPHLLDEYQINRLKEQKIRYERALINQGIYTPEEFEEIQRKERINNEKLMAEARKKREKKEQTRMTAETLFVVAIVACVMILLGNATYIYQSIKTGSFLTFGASMLVTLFILFIGAIGAYFVYCQYKKDFDRSEEEFANTTQQVEKSYDKYEKQYGDFYTTLLNYMKLQSMYIGIDNRKEKDVSIRKRLIDYSNAIKAATKRNEKWLRLYSRKRLPVKLDYTNGFDEIPIKNPIFYFNTSDENDMILINDTNEISAAYPFVKQIWIERDYLSDYCDEYNQHGNRG